MSTTVTMQKETPMSCNIGIHQVPVKALATATAALQRLNYRVKTLDPCERGTVFRTKIKLSETLCRTGFCTWRKIQHRYGRESLCKMYFRLGNQSFAWSLPTKWINFDVVFKDPPALYGGEPADETKIAIMTDRELLQTAVDIGSAPPSPSTPEVEIPQDSEKQQLAWLKAFHDENGRWPSRDEQYPTGNAIGMKVYLLRRRYKQGNLDWHIVQGLNEMKFPWDGKSFGWLDRYFEVYEFLKANSRWPSSGNGTAGAENGLAEWLSVQGRMYVYGTLSPRNKWLLDRLNYDWGGYSRKQSRYKTNR